MSSSGHQDSGDHVKDRGVPLSIQGLRSNGNESEFHAVFFDAEALVGKSEKLRSFKSLLTIRFLHFPFLPIQSNFYTKSIV